jgi:glutathione transport system permease protein
VGAYLARKLAALPLVLFGVSFLVFAAVRALPGDPARLMAGPEATAGAVAAMRARLGLDAPFVVQYLLFLRHAVVGDFGTSIRAALPVAGVIGQAAPYTVALAVGAYGVAVLVGIAVGTLAAVRRNSWFDVAATGGAVLAASVANFWLALLAMDLFAVQLRWLPLLGAGDWRHYVLPIATLAAFPTALIARMTRSSMLDVVRQDYVRTAFAKGLGRFVVYGKHALRNAMVPIVTIVGLNFGALLGGAVVTETVFNWPGLGRLLVDSVRFRDYPVIQALVLLAVISVVSMNLLADVVIALIDPRVGFARR